MRRVLRNESGSTLIAAVLIVFGMLAFGIALVAQADTQSQTSAKERTRESGFNLAEAALNAQVLQLTRAWAGNNGMPVYCDPTINNSRCPEPTAIGGGYTQGDYGTPCRTNASIPAWQTHVRDSQGEQYWTSSILTTRPAYDFNGDGVVWVRSQATAHCHTVAMVTQVSTSSVPIAFPSNVITANKFATNNEGRKVIVDTLGSGGQAAPIVARCSGLTTAQCLAYPANKNQVNPPAVRADSNASGTTLSASQLASLEAQAQSSGSHYSCTNNPTQLTSPASGSVVYLKGPNCNVNVTGNHQINSATKPGALIIEDGSITLGGTVTFYGLIYVVNKSNSSNYLVTTTGCSQIIGVISVDGLGGVLAGACKTNIVNDPRAVGLLKGSGGARVNKNTFRVIPTT
jgi:Tfp pilus assembly protein PilX